MTDNMKRFLEAVSSDEALQKEFKVLADSATKEADAHKSAIVELAAEHGFTLTEDYFKPSEMGELSMDELEAVAGGVCFCPLVGGGTGTGKQCVCGLSGLGTNDSGKTCKCSWSGLGQDD